VGQGNVVDPSSTNGTPDDVQTVALSDIIYTSVHPGHDLSLFILARKEYLSI
jgi:hypothetical protein